MRQFLALATLILAIITTIGLVRGLVAMTSSALERLYDARFDLSQAQKRAAQIHSISESATAEDERDLKTLLMWDGPASSGEARLQEVVNAELVAVEFALEYMRAVPASQHGSLSKVAVDLSGVGSEAGLYDLLKRLEKHRPIVTVERLAVRSTDPGQTGVDIPVGPQLAVDMRVVAFGPQSPVDHPSSQMDEPEGALP